MTGFFDGNTHRPIIDNSHLSNNVDNKLKNNQKEISNTEIANQEFKDEIKEKSSRDSALKNMIRSNKMENKVFDEEK